MARWINIVLKCNAASKKISIFEGHLFGVEKKKITLGSECSLL
jgi:hypothetical protein